MFLHKHFFRFLYQLTRLDNCLNISKQPHPANAPKRAFIDDIGSILSPYLNSYVYLGLIASSRQMLL